jgi:D-xylulose reductase
VRPSFASSRIPQHAFLFWANLEQLFARQYTDVIVFGAGPVGLLALATAKALGARRIISVDVSKYRLDFAREYAATDTWSPTKKAEGESNMDYSRREAQEMRKALKITERGQEAMDIVLDATGVEVSFGPVRRLRRLCFGG